MHPDADAFLDAIFDHPDDDTHRLVYADWLEENEQEDYAQFIRASVYVRYTSLLSAKRWRLNAEQKALWSRIEAVRHDAIKGLGLRDYTRGILPSLVVGGDAVTRTIDLWWPAMTPPSLTVYGAGGAGPRSTESELVTTIGGHLPWLRELCLRSPPSFFDAAFTAEPLLDGSLFTALASPGVLPRLRSLRVASTRVDRLAFRAFAESELASHLEELEIDVVSAGWAGGYRIRATAEQGPNAIRRALAAFVARHG